MESTTKIGYQSLGTRVCIQPKRMDMIDRIEFVQGGDRTAPIIIALTLELRE
jgi:hypothetical protein